MTQQNDPAPGTSATPAAVEPAKSFTQEQMNTVAAAARREEAAKYEDYDTLKARAGQADKLERDQMTEAQKLQTDLAGEQRKNAGLESQMADTMITAEIKVKASSMGLVDPDAAVAMINRAGIAYTPQTGVSGVEDAMTALVEAKPYLKAVVPATLAAPNINPGGQTPGPTPVTLNQDQLNMAAKLGQTAEQYAKGLSQTGPNLAPVESKKP